MVTWRYCRSAPSFTSPVPAPLSVLVRAAELVRPPVDELNFPVDQITVPDYQEVRGECSPGGHCLGVSPCKEDGCQREKYTKYSHEKCSRETETAPARGPPEDRLRLVRWS